MPQSSGTQILTDLFGKLIAVMGRLYTSPMLCVYVSECLAFLRFKQG